MKEKPGIISYLESYAEFLPGLIYWKDKSSIYRWLNKFALETIMLKSSDEIVGKSDFDLWPEYANEIVSHDLKVMQTGMPLQTEEVLNLPNGKIKYYTAVKVPLRDESGEIIGIIGNSVDITDTKEMEKLVQQNQIYQAKVEEQETFKSLVGQMIHDIQSPLSSLRTIVQSTTGIPENDRIALRNAAISISDITSQLLNKYKDPNAMDEKKQLILVSSFILQVLSEKRIEYKNNNIHFDYRFNPNAYFSFVKIEPSSFRRMLSNLINNSVDALEDKAKGNVLLSVKIDPEYVIISIDDNGKGMPKEVIDKITNNIKITQDKKEGHGLGFSQIQDTLNKNMGKLKIYSEQGFGTKISLYLPKMNTPNWIADKLAINSDDTVVILDDDSSIHAAWDAKLAIVFKHHSNITIKHFFEGQQVIDFINTLSAKDKRRVYLLSDYELLNQEKNGLQVIAEVNIAKSKSILVTSHHENDTTRIKASQMGIAILPKNLVYAIPIKIGKKVKPHSKKVDFVWVDDDKGFINQIIGKYYQHLKIDTFYDPISFQDYIDDYPLNTKIILDNHYFTENSAYPMDGVMLAEKLHEKGFTNLYLLSGEELPIKLDYLTVILKNDDEKVKSLDKLGNE